MKRKLERVDDVGWPHTLYFDEETERKSAEMNSEGLMLTALEGRRVIGRFDLSLFGKTRVAFGAAPDNDIVIAPACGVVSRHHGSFLLRGVECTIQDEGSTNGLYVNGVSRDHCVFQPGDAAWIGAREPVEDDGVLLLLSFTDTPWRRFDFEGQMRVSIGRDRENDIAFPSRVVSGRHAMLARALDGTWYVSDTDSYNGTFVNGAPVIGQVPLRCGDVLALADAHLVFMGSYVLINFNPPFT